jgi:hypothetical protein
LEVRKNVSEARVSVAPIRQITEGENDKLYDVTSIVKEFNGCKDVKLNWFYCDRTKRRPYAELIKDYDPHDDLAIYAAHAVDELFTTTEATALAEYLRLRYCDHTTTIEEATLPLPNDIMGLRGFPVGGGDGFYELHEDPVYRLWFKVESYFNLRGCELVDCSGVYHPRLLLLDGVIRMQTNAEAALNGKVGRNARSTWIP